MYHDKQFMNADNLHPDEFDYLVDTLPAEFKFFLESHPWTGMLQDSLFLVQESSTLF
jgi:hypothetical protein